MNTSFIAFIVLTVAIVAISAYRLGVKVSKAAKQEEAQNKIPYEKCLEKNSKAFKYGTFTDARDGETYRTVKIGGQTWMAENLRFKADGCFAPNNDEANVKKFGRLYTWTTTLGISEDYSTQSSANDIDQHNKIKDKHFQGIAPEGWHIPSNQEWEALLANIDPKSDGSEFRSECIWQKPGKDTFGFFALPAGYRFNNGTYHHFGRRARFWSKDEYGGLNAFRLSLTNNSVDIEGVYRSDAISVRCVKNA